MNIMDQVKDEVKKAIEEYKKKAEDHYDFWNEHIKYVYQEALSLAKKYNADQEIVELGALLHDIALICQVGKREDHHENGKIIAEQILTKYSYDVERRERVLGCVYNHRSSKNAKILKNFV